MGVVHHEIGSEKVMPRESCGDALVGRRLVLVDGHGHWHLWAMATSRGRVGVPRHCRVRHYRWGVKTVRQYQDERLTYMRSQRDVKEVQR